jgi:hypothetical protein
MTAHLPEGFQLPTGATYDEAIADLDLLVQDKGSASRYLFVERERKKNCQSFDQAMLGMAAHTLRMEEVNEDDGLEDPKHLLANVALSGMIFGDFINERIYPNMNQKIRPYQRICVTESILGEYTLRFIAAKGVSTHDGRRIGYSSMALTQLARLGEDAGRTIHSWSDDIVSEDQMKSTFTSGVGLSLFAAWDAYRDAMIAGERTDVIELDALMAENTLGED